MMRHIKEAEVLHDEAHKGGCDEFVSGLGRRLPVNYDVII
jgi:hypothetical protein